MKQSASKFPPPSRLTLPALALCLTPLIGVPAYAADKESAKPSAPAAASRITTIDPTTNTLRAPEANEPAPAAAQGATARAAPGQSMLSSPNAARFQQQQMFGRDGTVTMRLGLDTALRFSVAHRHADGTLHKDCVVGEDGVHTHLNTLKSKRETNHE